MQPVHMYLNLGYRAVQVVSDLPPDVLNLSFTEGIVAH